jgi:hypothetical protein
MCDKSARVERRFSAASRNPFLYEGMSLPSGLRADARGLHKCRPAGSVSRGEDNSHRG